MAFPVSAAERDDRVRAQLVSCARRLAQLVAEPAARVPKKAAAAIEEAVGLLLEELDAED